MERTIWVTLSILAALTFVVVNIWQQNVIVNKITELETENIREIKVELTDEEKRVLREHEEQKKIERAEQTAEARQNAIDSRNQWLRENPPVDVLFDGSRIYDEDYVIDYLRRNKIGGHCALVWRPDVVCVDGGIRFPTERGEVYTPDWAQ